MDKNKNQIQKLIIQKGISLLSIGIKEHALKCDDVFPVIYLLKQKQIPVLGGDVYHLEDGQLIPSLDSWYVREEDLAKSWDKAIEYIKLYEMKSQSHNYYVIVY